MKLFGSKSRRMNAEKAPVKKHGRVLRIVLGAILCTVLLVVIAWAVMIRKPEPPPSDMNTVNPVINPDPTETPNEPVSIRREDTWVFLVVGCDAGLLTEDGDINTDTMMIGSLDLVSGELNVVSIPRDTLVNVSWDIKKANSLLYDRETKEKNIDILLNGVRELLGFSVDYYAIVDLAAFERLVDTIGGVDFEIPVNMNYFDPKQDLRINFTKGMRHLNGEEAMKVMRYRGYPMPDIQRIETQQNFIKAVAKQLMTPASLLKINDFADIMNECVDTNMKVTDMIWFMEQLFGMSADNIRFATVPGDFSLEIYGLSYGSIDIEAWVEMINTRLNPFTIEVTPEMLNILTFENGEFHSTTGVIEGGIESFRFYRP